MAEEPRIDNVKPDEVDEELCLHAGDVYREPSLLLANNIGHGVYTKFISIGS